MTLFKWVREEVSKYSFVKRTNFTGSSFYIYYEKDGNERFKRLPYRATKDQLETTINNIKKEINYEEFISKRREEVRKQVEEEEAKNKESTIYKL